MNEMEAGAERVRNVVIAAMRDSLCDIRIGFSLGVVALDSTNGWKLGWSRRLTVIDRLRRIHVA